MHKVVYNSAGTPVVGVGAAPDLMAPTTKTVSFTVQSGQPIYLCDCTSGNIAITGAAKLAGRNFVIKRTDSSGNTIIYTPSSGTIEGSPTLTITAGLSVWIYDNGTNEVLI